MHRTSWRWERGVVGWNFRLPMLGMEPVAAMEFHARRFLGAVDGFAAPAEAAWTTTSDGEDAVVQERGTVIDEETFARTFRERPDIEVLVVGLDLIVTPADGGDEETIEDGGALTLEIIDERLIFDVYLNADVHFRRTYGWESDNEALGRLNESRLFAFVARLRELGAFLEGVEANSPAYREQLAAWPPHLTAPTRPADLHGLISRDPENDIPRLALADPRPLHRPRPRRFRLAADRGGAAGAHARPASAVRLLG